MKLQDFNNLAEDPASVPWSVKSIALLFVMAVIGFLGYKLVITTSLEELEAAERKETELRASFETKHKRASQLPQYQAQLADMERSFSVLLRQLPSDTEIPGLILDISEKGLSNGLELELFEPQAEVQKEFYAEKPIKLIAKGSYRELAMFVSDVSGLSRIVTLNNIDLQPEDNSERLRMISTLKTFRYLDDSSTADVPAAQGDKEKGKAKPAPKAAGGQG